MKLLQGDCLELMKGIPDGSIDMILCDMPYGTTACKWDKRLDLEAVWTQYRRVIRSRGCIALFSQLPFAVDIINANRAWYRYEWIWQKSRSCGFLNANKMPLRVHENILIFYDHLPTYHPQMVKGKPYTHRPRLDTPVYSNRTYLPVINETGDRYPRDIIPFPNAKIPPDAAYQGTQKPVALLEYLIRTYTDEGEVVLDNCMGSGSTGVACVHTNRDFIGMELDGAFYEKACAWIQREQEARDHALVPELAGLTQAGT